MTDNILFSADSYKYTHDKMLPNNTQGVYSYFEARKASKKGRLSLILNEINKYQTIQETSERDILDLVFENGKLIREQTFSEIREIVRRNWV